MEAKQSNGVSMNLIADRMKDRYTRVRDRVHIIEFCLNFLCGIKGIITGSRAEGPHNHDSDTDFVKLSSDLIAVGESDKMCSTDRVQLLMTSEETYPGHVRLKVAEKENSHNNLEILQLDETLHSLCIENQPFLSTKKVLENWSKSVQRLAAVFGKLLKKEVHGPSIQVTWTHASQNYEMDLLYGIPCSNWPEEALLWFNRKRAYQWPDKAVLECIQSKGTFVVPFGRAWCGDISESDWRISFSHAERELMWSLNAPQLLCYDFLKRLSKVLNLLYPNCFQSYHLKTSFLWILGNTPPCAWKSEFVIQRAVDCVAWLVDNLKRQKILNYFIPANNMFKNISEHMTEEFIEYLQTVTSPEHGIWEKFIEESCSAYREDLLFKYHVYLNAFAVSRQLTLYALIHDSPDACQVRLQENIETLQDNIHRESLVYLRPLINALKGHLGSLTIRSEIINPDSVQGCSGFPPKPDTLANIDEGCKVDKYSGKLKKATILEKLAQPEAALCIVDEVLDSYGDHVVYMSSFSVERKEPFNDYPKQGMLFEEFMQEYLALDVAFLPSETHTAPECIGRFLSAGRTVLIHPITYALFMRFVLLFRLERRDKLGAAVQALEQNIQDHTHGRNQIDRELLAHCQTLFASLNI